MGILRAAPGKMQSVNLCCASFEQGVMGILEQEVIALCPWQAQGDTRGSSWHIQGPGWVQNELCWEAADRPGVNCGDEAGWLAWPGMRALSGLCHWE